MKTCSYAAVAAVSLLSCAQLAQAHSSSLEHVLVSAARTPLAVSQIGSATTVLTREDIERRQARYVSDVLRTVPGFAISHTGGMGTQTQVRVRGSEANHVLVLIDGVRANDPATGDEFRWEQLSTAGIERIEVVRGPQSALWGSEAVAAVVNIVTASDRIASPAVELYTEAGGNRTRNVGGSAAASFGDWTLRGALDALRSDGENIARGPGERDGSRLATGQFGLQYRGEGPLSAQGSLRVSDARSEFDPVDFFTTGLPVDGDREARNRTTVAQLNTALRSFDDRVTWHLRGAYMDSDQRDFADDQRVSGAGAERTTVTLQSDIALGEDALTLGVEREKTDFSQRGLVQFGDPNQDQSLTLNSVMAEYRSPRSEGLSWIVSSRYDQYSDFRNALTGRLSLSYPLGDSTRLRGTVGSGQKTPTFTERFGFFPEQFIGNPDLKPERSVSYDLGIDQDFADGRLQLSGTLFWQDLRDEINGFVFDPVSFLATAENVDGKSRRSGTELSGEWALSDALSLRAMYTYTRAREPDTATGRSVAELRRPKHSASLALQYSGLDDRLGLSAVADYGGARLDRFFPPFPEPAAVVRLDDYWLVELTAQYRLSTAATVFARATNLLDSNYEQVLGYTTPGRVMQVGLRLRW
jgi:vitamin B12 transporter